MSYRKLTPNRLGVTAIAEINDAGAYKRRYDATRRMLGRPVKSNRETSMKGYTPGQQRAMKKMSAKRRANFKKMLKGAGYSANARGKKKTARPRSHGYAPNRAARPSKAAFIEAQLDSGATPKQAKARWDLAYGKHHAKAAPKKRKAPKKRAAAKRKAAPKKRAPKRKAPKKRAAAKKRPPAKKLTKAAFLARQGNRGRSEAQALADWKLTRRGKGKAKAAPKRQRRVYGGKKRKVKALRSRVGTKSRWTYMFKTKRGGTRHIPEHILLGYPSRAAVMKTLETGSDRKKLALAMRMERIAERRRKAAAKTSARIMRGRGVFTPNAGDEDILSFDDWSEDMKPNRTRKQTAASRRNIKKAQAALRRKRKGGTRRKTAKRKTRKGKKRVSSATRKRISVGLKRYHRSCKRKPSRKRKTTTRRKTTRRKTTRSKRDSRGRYIVHAGSYRKNRGYAKNRHKSRKMTYRRNQNSLAVGRKTYTDKLMAALKLGTFALGGYIAHRAVTKLVDEQVLGKITALQTGDAAQWRGTIASAVVAMAAVPAAIALLPGDSAAVAAGIAASFLHGLIIRGLQAAKQDKIASYLSAYPNAEGSVFYGSGMGAYYTFKPGQIYGANGVGEYYETSRGPLHVDQLTQAAAGMGQLHVDQLTQAAAGNYHGGNGSPLVTQAAAGNYGGNGSALVTQAAAGEYLVYGAQGMGGNYEEIPTRGMAVAIDNGTAPNLHSAEQALDVVEAAAGVGMAEVPYQSTVDPSSMVAGIPHTPGGSRDGVFGTPDGIFGGPAM